MHKRSMVCSLVAAALLTIMPGVPACSQDDSVTFTFNPPTPSSHTITLKTTKIKSTGPSDTQTDVGVAKVKIGVRKTAKGYKLIQTPISVDLTRNGEKFPSNPIVDRLMKVVVTSDLDSFGEMLTVKGFDEVFKALTEELKSAMPPEQYEKFAAALPGMKEAAIAKEITEWNGRIASFVGRTAKIGDTWVEDQTAELPLGTIVYDTTTKIAERVLTGKADCVRITFSYTTDAEGTQKFMQAVMDSLAESAAPGKSPKIVDVKITGGGERVIDPKTMLIYSETNDRTITMAMDIPDEGRQELKMQEKREYTYQYGK